MPRKYSSWARRKIRADRRAAADSADAEKVVKEIQTEAEENDATLANDGKGGIDPRIALKVFRRAKWRCENDKCPTPKDELDLDHISGHPAEIQEDDRARKNRKLEKGVKKGHVDDTDALHVLCKKCHDAVHQRERAIENDKKPAPMRGNAA